MNWSEATNEHGVTPRVTGFSAPAETRPIGRHAVIYAFTAGFLHHAKSLKKDPIQRSCEAVLYTLFFDVDQAKAPSNPGAAAVSFDFGSLLQGVAASFFCFRKRLSGDSHPCDLPRIGLPTADRDVDIEGVEFDGSCPAARLMRGHDGRA
jgi:hypothetical protein